MDYLIEMLTFKLSSTRIGLLIGGGGVVLAVTAIMGLPPRSMIILAGGMLLVAAVVALFFMLMKVRAKQKFAAGDEAIQDEMRKRPRKMNNPEALAKVADLSKRFERGVSLYKQATGQRLTECPWYLFTGTPGSGKTEAIRHCGIGMPEGLHEEQQGAGGTVNMDWWFTDDAIILDTAGRYLTDVDSTSEWEEFLKLLNRARPDAPINGMLVALPADSLLKDSSEEVQRKGTEIAKFLDRVRRTLGVRFPVFIVVTKSDLIPGFREFFAHVSDSDLQSQIVGWSKPGDLDEPFEPDDVEDYLQTLRATLIRRRMGLLVDPIHTEDVSGRRLDQVDALYMFPDGLLGIGPRLKRYLQMVFVKSKFNQNPLFLRGIYFTQAFEEGAALDEALARIRNVPLEQLEAEGRGWRRDRALFLRDLFEKKVFRENGLVTRASNTGQLKRKRRLTLLGTAFAFIALLGVFIYYSHEKLSASIEKESAFWKDIKASQTKHPESLDLMDAGALGTATTVSYIGDKPTTDTAHIIAEEFFGGQKLDRDRAALITSDLEIPKVFKLLLLTDKSNFNAHRRAAFQVLFNRHVLLPLIRDVCNKLKTPDAAPVASTDKTWTIDGLGVKALVELLKLESVYNGTPPSESVKFAPLFQYLQPIPMPNDDAIKNLQDTYESIYALDGSPKLPDYTLALKQALDSVHTDLDLGATSGTQLCINYWHDRCNNSQDIQSATNAINKFQQWRDAIGQTNYFSGENPVTQPKNILEYEGRRGRWTDWSDPVVKAYADLKALPKIDPQENWKKDGLLSLKPNYQLQVTRQINGAREVFDVCNRAIFPASGKLAEPLNQIRENLDSVAKSPPQNPEAATLLQNAEACDKWGAVSYQDKDKKKKRLAYEIVSDLCDRATKLLPDDLNDAAALDLISEADEFNSLEKETNDQIADSAVAEPTMNALGHLYSSLIAPAAAYAKLKNDLKQFPDSAADFKTAVINSLTGDSEQQTPIALPLTGNADFTLDRGFNGYAFATQIDKWNEIKNQIDPSNKGGTTRPLSAQFPLVSILKPECRARQTQVDDAINNYYTYWSSLSASLVPTKQTTHIDNWDKVKRQINGEFDVEDINRMLVTVYSAQIAALKDKTFLTPQERSISSSGLIPRLTQQRDICAAMEGGYGKDDSCILNWRNLANKCDATQAQLEILAMKPEDFRKRYIAVEKVPYWKAISTIILTTLATDVKDSTEKKLKGFRDACKRYPVDASQSPANAIANAKDASDILEPLKNISDAVFPAGTIGSGLDTNTEEIDSSLHDLQVGTLSLKEKRQKDILTSLSNSKNGDVKVTFLPRKADAKTADLPSQFAGILKEPLRDWTSVRVREWDLTDKDLPTDTDALKWQYNATHKCGTNKLDIGDRPFPQQLSGLTVLFRDDSDRSRIDRDINGVPKDATQFQGPWPFISMILAQDSQNSPAQIATKISDTVWIVEVPDPAHATSVLIQLEIPNSNYPSVADWPRSN